VSIRLAIAGLAVMLGLTALAAAATIVIGRGDPIGAPRPGDVPVELQPVEGSARLSGLGVPDPDGGPAWDLRTSRGRTGSVCATVGQVRDGELGLLGLDRRFRSLPSASGDTCAARAGADTTLAGARAFRGGGRLGDLTVVSGLLAPGVRAVGVIAAERRVPTAVGADRTFLAVMHGRPEALRPRVVLTERSGLTTTLRFADSGELTVADPSGGAPWTLRYSVGRGGLRCVSAVREPGPDSRVASVPRRCGPPARPFVAIRRFVPQVRTGASLRWGLQPARTVVWGSTSPAGDEPLLLGAGPARRLPVDRLGGGEPLPDGMSRTPSGRGGFLAVLDGRVDPRRLRVIAGGRRLAPGAALDAAGRRVGREPLPAWRSVAAVARRSGVAAPLVVEPGSVAISRRTADSTATFAWALRSWSARTARGARFTCFAIGIEQRGRLVEPLPDSAFRIVGTGAPDAQCTPLRRPARQLVTVRTYLDDAASRDPQPRRVVAAGLLGDGARRAELLRAGAPRPLALGRHGTFLAVLGPEHAGVRLALRVLRRKGGWRTSLAFGVARACNPQPGLSVRVPDPDGGPSWTAGRGRAAGRSCRYVGRAIGDRVATIATGHNWATYEPMMVSVLFARQPRRSDRPLTMFVNAAAPAPPPAAPSRAQVARRTLSGRTILSGAADERVRAITLRTPRDVRTVRPGPGGLFLVVYDGAFYGGQIDAIAALRGGRTVTETLPLGYRNPSSRRPGLADAHPAR
jgi:hypothetical protein